MIRVTDAIAIDEREIDESFVRAAGPGGQNVNKLATAVQLRFDVRRSPSLSEEVRARLEKLAGRRLTQEGVLILSAQRHRTQERNRQDALERLVELVQRAARPAGAATPHAAVRRRQAPPAGGQEATGRDQEAAQHAAARLGRTATRSRAP